MKTKNEYYMKLAFYIYTVDNMKFINEGIDFFRKLKKLSFSQYYKNFDQYKKDFMRCYYNWYWVHQQKIANDKNEFWQNNKIHVSYILYIMKILKHYHFKDDFFYINALFNIEDHNKFNFIEFLSEAKPFSEKIRRCYIKEIILNGEYDYFSSDNICKYSKDKGLSSLINHSYNYYLLGDYNIKQLIAYTVFMNCKDINKSNEVLDFIENNPNYFSSNGNIIHNILNFIRDLKYGSEMPIEWQYQLNK